MVDNEPAPPLTLTASTVRWTLSDVPAGWAALEVPVVDSRHYRIDHEVARGGVGRILAAVDNRLGREVAVKQLLRRGANEARFIREAVLTARLQHPAIIPIHELGVFESGAPFIAMKLVKGESLRDAIRHRPQLASRLELVSAVVSVAEAVAYAHSQRVIHRDLKPANVLLGSFGEVVVIDWGLAKHLDAGESPASGGCDVVSDQHDTATGAILGTPAYMAPEQAAGQSVDERADVYSLGAMLYEVLVGRPPLSGATVAEVLHDLSRQAVRPLDELVSNAPGDLVAIVRRAMQPDPAQRYDAAGMAADLRRYQIGHTTTVSRTVNAEPAIESAFQRELAGRTADAVKVFTLMAIVLLSAFVWVPRLVYGSFEMRDFVPRFVAVGLLAVACALAFTGGGKKFSQELAVLAISIVGVTLVVVNLLDNNSIGWFTESTLLLYLGSSALLPIRPGRTTAVLVLLTMLAPCALWPLHRAGHDIKLVLEVSLVMSGALIAAVGSWLAHRTRRAEFYNRQRLQTANERLARFEPRKS
jgi:hypothetical protein